jgi:Domain of unknown function (DUF5615)
MQIYLDDSSDDDDLVAFLTQAGHTVYTPRSEQTRGASDERHLAYAAARNHLLLTHNPADFRRLHSVWQAQGRTHAGILLVYQDNIRGKDMEPADIPSAIDHLLASGVPITNEVHILNQWR